MSVQAMSYVISHSKQKGNSFVILLMIANYAKADGSGAWPSILTLARDARVSERTVQRSIATLVRMGELRVRLGKGPHGTHLYDVMGVKLSPPVSNCQGRGDKKSPGGCQALSPNPSLSTNKRKSRHFNGVTLSSADVAEREALYSQFPELKPEGW